MQRGTIPKRNILANSCWSFRILGQSAVHESALHHIHVLLYKLEKPKFVRWLSHDAAVSALLAIIASQRHDPAAKN